MNDPFSILLPATAVVLLTIGLSTAAQAAAHRRRAGRWRLGRQPR